uniref:Uncharacterized protein n=1 Tax=Opuntia streptacantha TaxID=393608 RepID=A0A7C9AWC6_OPUST
MLDNSICNRQFAIVCVRPSDFGGVYESLRCDGVFASQQHSVDLYLEYEIPFINIISHLKAFRSQCAKATMCALRVIIIPQQNLAQISNTRGPARKPIKSILPELSSSTSISSFCRWLLKREFRSTTVTTSAARAEVTISHHN